MRLVGDQCGLLLEYRLHDGYEEAVLWSEVSSTNLSQNTEFDKDKHLRKKCCLRKKKS